MMHVASARSIARAILSFVRAVAAVLEQLDRKPVSRLSDHESFATPLWILHAR